MPTSPLNTLHEQFDAKFTDFAGWRMPVHYGSILEEHHGVRSRAGLFDISHMTQIWLEGAASEDWLNHCFSRDVAGLRVSRAHYTLLLNEQGGIVDDLILNRLGKNEFLVVANAARRESVWEVLSTGTPEFVRLDHRTKDAGIALQGPESAKIWEVATQAPWLKRHDVLEITWQGSELILAGTGYTGEPGCEVFGPWQAILALSEKLISAGSRLAGLGCRDTLRLEMGYALNGSDLNPGMTPYEAGLGHLVSIGEGQPEFIGRKALVGREEPERRLMMLRIEPGGAPPRAGCRVLNPADLSEWGVLSSGGVSPTQNCGLGLALLPSLLLPEQKVLVEVRGSHRPAALILPPKKPSQLLP